MLYLSNILKNNKLSDFSVILTSQNLVISSQSSVTNCIAARSLLFSLSRYWLPWLYRAPDYCCSWLEYCQFLRVFQRICFRLKKRKKFLRIITGMYFHNILLLVKNYVWFLHKMIFAKVSRMIHHAVLLQNPNLFICLFLTYAFTFCFFFFLIFIMASYYE